MKRIFSFLFAILFAVGTTGVFTSCQEDAPEITINITMNNDFSDVVNAINNGTLKQEAAIAALTAAIEKMQGDQDSKLQAIADAINSLATTVDAKLAIIEAAMKAQTLALETKLDLLEAAIKALPDYSDKLAAIEAAIAALPNYGEQLEAIAAAIEALPNYTEQMGALETALETIAENIEAQEGQYADELAALKTSIDAIKSEVAAGNKSQKDALAEIIALLESGAIAGGGSGSGGEGSGGEGSGDEPIGPYILLTTEKPVGSTIEFACYDSELTNISGVDNLKETGYWVGDYGKVPLYQGILTKKEVKLYGTFTEFQCSGGGLTEIDTQTQGALVHLMLYDNPDLKTFNFKFNESLKKLDFRGNSFSASELSDLVKQLSPTSGGQLKIDFDGTDDAFVVLRDAAAEKGWTIYR